MDCKQRSLRMKISRGPTCIGDKENSGFCSLENTTRTEEIFQDAALRFAIKGAEAIVKYNDFTASVEGTCKGLERMLETEQIKERRMKSYYTLSLSSG